MARLYTSGFEMNSLTANVEWTSIQSTPSIQGTTVRSGSYALEISSLSSGSVKGVRYQFGAANGNGPFYARMYFRYATLPSAANQVFQFLDSSVVMRTAVELNSDGTLQLRDEDSTIGSPSAALSANTWYQVEMLINTTAAAGSHVVEARLNGTVFATASNRNISTGVNLVRVGGNLATEAQTTGSWFFDDIAVNDSNGSFQTSYPGSGKVVMLVPSAAGGSNAWLNTAGGAGSTNNYQLVDEIPPNDGTDLIQSNTLNATDMYECSTSGMGSLDTVNCVAVMVRFRNNTADATTAYRVRIIKTSGGTASESANIVPNSATWRGNDPSAVKTSPLTLYKDPDNSDWTQSTIESMLLGVKLIVTGTNNVQVSALYVYVEYVPVQSTAVRNGVGVQSCQNLQNLRGF